MSLKHFAPLSKQRKRSRSGSLKVEYRKRESPTLTIKVRPLVIKLEKVLNNIGWFAFYATAEEAESLLHTEFHEYEDSVTGGIMPSCEQYHVPSTIRHHIDYVTPGIKLNVPTGSFKGSKRNFMTAKQTPSASSILKPEIQPGRNNLSTCDSTITPACIAALYAISKSNPHPHPNNSMGVYESDLEFYTQKDLDLFFTTFTDIPNGTHPVAANIDGGQQSTKDLYEAGNEVSLDLQCAYPVSTTFV